MKNKFVATRCSECNGPMIVTNVHNIPWTARNIKGVVVKTKVPKTIEVPVCEDCEHFDISDDLEDEINKEISNQK